MRYYFVLIVIIIPYLCNGQITSPLSGAVRYTSYPSDPAKKDQIFIFCNATGSQKGSLNAQSPGGTGPFSFSWYMWSDLTKSFSIFLRTDASAYNSISSNLDDGGYSVRVTDGGGFDTTMVAWIFLDKKPVAEASLQQQTCYRVALRGRAEASINNYYYKDPLTGASIALKNDVAFLWSSSPESFIPGPNINISPIIENYPNEPPVIQYRLPFEDVTYKLNVNTLGCSNEASFEYTSIHVKAEFTVDPEKGEAPLEVSFTDKSIHGSVYKWEFGDDSVSTITNPLPHIYYRPGEYTVKLTVESDLTCSDFVTFEKIVVDPSELNIPNVFTPDGDGLNDFFIVQSKSLRTIDVEVFSRSGVKVYTFSGEGQPLDNWEGWDGSVNNSSTKAAPGIYFYIIRARGWDDKVYNGKEHRGFVYLYR